MSTCFLPPNTACNAASALIRVLFFLSCNPFFLMYCQSCLVSSVRGSGFEPTTNASFSLGWTGFMNAAFGFRLAAISILLLGLVQGHLYQGTRAFAAKFDNLCYCHPNHTPVRCDGYC